jgi:chitinase
MKLLLSSVFLIAATIVSVVAPYSSEGGGSVVVGYYADWTAAKLPADKIPYSKLTHINYAFGVLDENNKIQFDTKDLLKKVVELARPHNTKVLLALGGWTGSKNFSPMVKSAAKRSDFIKQALDLINEYGLAGVDIDWEFPGRMGLDCNIVDPLVDASNFLELLKELRTALNDRFGSGKKQITLAVRVAPFDGPNGPIKDVRAYAKVIDYISIMAYDINGAWSDKSGPNAPLDAGKESLVGSVKEWMDAGWPASKIAAGVGFYGRAVTATEGIKNDSAVGLSISKTVPQGDSEDAPWAEPCPGKTPVLSGVWQWRLIKEGPLKDSKWKKGWDSKSQTPWLWNDSTRTFVSYDDPKSLKIKADWARCKGLAGIMIWALHQDDQDYTLTKTVQAIHDNGKCQ